MDHGSTISESGSGELFYGQDAHHMGNQSDFTDKGNGTVTDLTILI